LAELERALAILQAAPVSLRAPLLYAEAAALSVRGDVAEALEKLAAADTACARLADPYVQARGATAAAHVSFSTMRMARASECERQVRDAMTALGRPWDAIDKAYMPVFAHVLHGRAQEAATLVDDFEPRAERIGHRGCQVALRLVRPVLRHLAGDLPGAEPEARSAVEFARVHHICWAIATPSRR
jgi:hypothetical protein